MKSFLKTADKIGEHLVETAFWDDDKNFCNWLGRRDIEDREIAKYSVRTAALSPELYSGSTGIALFLIELFGVTGKEEFQKTAVSSWLRSVDYMRTNEFPATPISFYAGQLGLAYVGYRILELSDLHEETVRKEIKWLLSNLANGLKVKHSLDVIGGNAGAIAPLLYLAKKYDLKDCKKIAVACAEEIVELGVWKDEICFWSPQKVHGVELELPPLTGYSHGASGLGLGLLEAYRETGNKTFLEYGRGAFAFEESLFNEDEGNWIDTRYAHNKKDGKITGTFKTSWCHGAPGMALSYMQSSFIDSERREYYENRGEIAIATTKNALTEKLKTPEKDATLCHGILGLSDIIFTYGKRTDNGELTDYAKTITHDYIRKFRDPLSMASGLGNGGYSPCLMVGLAGIGLHCLRLYNHSIASVLVITP